MAMRLFLLGLAFFLTSFLTVSANPTYVCFSTNVGNINVELYDTVAPNTVANFLSYVKNGAYANVIIHRSIPGFIFQGGGYTLVNATITPVTANAPVMSEHSISNTRGTIAMALSTGKDSGTNQWFFNLVNNDYSKQAGINLDDTSDGGPFTVFGVVADTASLAVMDQIGTEPTFDASSFFGGDFTNLPLVNYDSSVGLETQNFILVSSITKLIKPYSNWQTSSFTAPQLADPNFIAPRATPFNDGVSNLLKYVCDINPSGPMSVPDLAKLPKVGKTAISGTTYLTFTYQQILSLSGVTVNVQTSPDLVTWTNVPQSEIVQSGTDSTSGDPIMQAQIPSSGSVLFFRLNIS
jgi:peptidyl-prolyl cis-trans isomerase A (cyclophilin A)